MTARKRAKPERESFLSKWTKVIKATTPLRPQRGVRPRRKQSALRPGVERNPKFLAFVRTLPCVVAMGQEAFLRVVTGTYTWGDVARMETHRAFPTEAAHIGPHGISQKASDYTAIPLTAWNHREGPESAHKLGKQFAEHHKLDLPRIQAAILARFEAERAA